MTLYTLHLHSAICQLYLNKAEEGKRQKDQNFESKITMKNMAWNFVKNIFLI